MNKEEYAACVVKITKVLTDRCGVLTINDSIKLAIEIMNVIINEGLVEQE